MISPWRSTTSSDGMDAKAEILVLSSLVAALAEATNFQVIPLIMVTSTATSRGSPCFDDVGCPIEEDVPCLTASKDGSGKQSGMQRRRLRHGIGATQYDVQLTT
mmetsp:Transcript_148879/g.270956  ORF Transcript_148879/g.270956 Transcript_148879/m.270956 type:complete len:104 (+) Transcript_148879:1135-1446(+)